jgi:hypothetical protein
VFRQAVSPIQYRTPAIPEITALHTTQYKQRRPTYFHCLVSLYLFSARVIFRMKKRKGYETSYSPSDKAKIPKSQKNKYKNKLPTQRSDIERKAPFSQTFHPFSLRLFQDFQGSICLLIVLSSFCRRKIIHER